MAAYTLLFTKSAQKEFDLLAAAIQNRVLDGLQVLKQNPFSELLRVKKLKGADALYRFRVGDYRVVYELRRHALVVLVIKIGHRKDVYR